MGRNVGDVLWMPLRFLFCSGYVVTVKEFYLSRGKILLDNNHSSFSPLNVVKGVILASDRSWVRNCTHFMCIEIGVPNS